MFVSVYLNVLQGGKKFLHAEEMSPFLLPLLCTTTPRKLVKLLEQCYIDDPRQQNGECDHDVGDGQYHPRYHDPKRSAHPAPHPCSPLFVRDLEQLDVVAQQTGYDGVQEHLDGRDAEAHHKPGEGFKRDLGVVILVQIQFFKLLVFTNIDFFVVIMIALKKI